MSQSDMVVPECCVCHAKIAGYKTCPNCMSLQCSDCHDFVGQCGTYACESHTSPVAVPEKPETTSLEKIVKSPDVDLKSLQQLQEVQKRVDTYQVDPAPDHNSIEYKAKEALTNQDTKEYIENNQFENFPTFEARTWDYLTKARLYKSKILKVTIGELFTYTQVCKDLFTVNRFMDAVIIAKESQNKDLVNRVTFAVGSRYQSVKLWAQACDTFLEGNHYNQALSACINANILDEPSIYKVFEKMRLTDKSDVFAARTLKDIMSRISLTSMPESILETSWGLFCRVFTVRGFNPPASYKNIQEDIRTLLQSHYAKAQEVLEQQHDYLASYNLAVEFKDETRIKKYAELSGIARTLLEESSKI